MNPAPRFRSVRFVPAILLAVTVLIPVSVTPAAGQALRTPLSQDLLDLLTDEISGQMAFNNEVLLAGAPWIRSESEFTDTFWESEHIVELARGYGVEDIDLIRQSSERTFDYPLEAEFWLDSPQRRLVARLGADAALVARGTVTSDVAGELIYIPPLDQEEIEAVLAGRAGTDWAGTIALMWSHARGNVARALDAAGVQGVISFSSRDRYLDPGQVVYSSGTYGQENLKLGFTVSWRQWSELLEDVEAGRHPMAHCTARVEEFPDKFETVWARVPGTEPDAPGVIFTAHLFEGYTKRGANDNMSGCVIQLEILRALTHLIESGELPRPRRTIHFLWPNEISGTYRFIETHPELVDAWSININMDIVGEALRLNNSWFTMSECPNHLPSYLDGLAASILNYVWRTNDIVYLPDSPHGRSGGQFFPRPLVEKNGSTDAFRFYIHRATGGSDHLCFNNQSVQVPGIEFFTWPDQWYHADTDTPDKSDPTQMKRVAFIGAACAWAAAHCTDEVLDGLLTEVAEFGYSRVADRELPRALTMIEEAGAGELPATFERALNLVDFAVQREIEALLSLREIYSGSPRAVSAVDARTEQMRLFGRGLQEQIAGYAGVRAEALGTAAPRQARPTRRERELEAVFPTMTEAVKGRVFSLGDFEPFREYTEAHPEAAAETGIDERTLRTVLNYISGERSITRIRDSVAAESGQEIDLEGLYRLFEILKETGWVSW